MSNDLAKREEQPLAAAGNGSGDRRPPSPLRQLPEDWREPVAFFYAIYSDTLKGTVGLVARFRLWKKQLNLTLDEAKLAMDRLMRPEHAAAIQFPGQLMAALAEAVVLVRKERQEAEAKEAQRLRLAAEAERFEGEGEPIGRTHVRTL